MLVENIVFLIQNVLCATPPGMLFAQPLSCATTTSNTVWVGDAHHKAKFLTPHFSAVHTVKMTQQITMHLKVEFTT